jgi:hypothetical protein
VVFYKVDQVCAPSHDGGLYWADPALAIEWPVTTGEAQVSQKDRSLPRLDQLTAVSNDGERLDARFGDRGSRQARREVQFRRR